MNYNFITSLQKEIWEKKYKSMMDQQVENTWGRVAKFVASAELTGALQKFWENEFYNILKDFYFIPGGRITEGAGTAAPYLNNCFVLDIEDSLEDIYETVKRVAIISKKNGGVGMNFRKIRPKDAPLSGGGVGSGVVSFMNVFNTSCEVIKTGSKNRRAALIALLDVSHPEIFEFIDAKRTKGALTNFNISVSIPDTFMKAVQEDGDWDLVFEGKVYRTVKARELWDKLCYSGWMYNDPGVFFYDTVNKFNNGWYMYDITTTNPCGELGLPAWAACCLGNINLTKFIIDPFSDKYWEDNFDWIKYERVIGTAVRFLDNVLDVSLYPYEENERIAKRDRRIGLNGIAGLGSACAMLCLPYDTEEARNFAYEVQEFATITAYNASIKLAKEKGSFPSLDISKFCQSGFIKKLGSLESDIALYGIRNIALMTIPPVGTGSLLAGNISNGLEPIFALEYDRNILQADGSTITEPVEDYAWKLYKEYCIADNPVNVIPAYFKTSREIDPKDHIKMQAIVQEMVDGSISKTANMPESYTLEQYGDLLMFAWKAGLKGFTTFREGTREGVLVARDEKKADAPVALSDCPPDLTKRKRPRVLDGKTYQVKEKEDNNYITICSYEDEDGTKKPWEIFVHASGKNAEWYAAIGRLASRLMRKTDDAQGVIEELKSIGGEHGFFTEEYGYLQSRPQQLGFILEEYMESLKEVNLGEKTITFGLESKPSVGKITGEKCLECGGDIVKRGGCSQCENGCISSYKCG